jgi:hypothetical protein
MILSKKSVFQERCLSYLDEDGPAILTDDEFTGHIQETMPNVFAS